MKLLLTLLTVLFLSPNFAHSSCQSRLFSKLGNRSLVTTGNQTDGKVLLRSDQIFSKMAKIMSHAKKDIYLQTWRFDVKSKPVKYLQRGISKLSKLRRSQGATRPVNLWLLINVTKLQNRTKEKKKIKNFIKKNSSKYVRIHYTLFTAKKLGANHAKSVSVDNTIALVTGANMSHNNDGLGFYDSGFIVKGQIVSSITKDFVKIWHSWSPKGAPKPKVTKALPSYNCLPILFATTKAVNQFRAPIQNSSLNNAVLRLIRNSRKSISILTPNLNVELIIEELRAAVKRGVVVRIVLSKGFEELSENLFTRGGANYYSVKDLYWPLITHYKSRKNTCAKLQIKWYSNNGKKIVRGSKPPASHAKYMVVDGQVTVIGSQNMDNQSWINSREIGLIIDSASRARSWQRQVFNPVFNKAIAVEQCGGPIDSRSR